MSSRHSILLENDNIASEASSITSESTLPNVFSRIIGLAPVIQSTVKRDCYTRLIPQYNHNHDLYKKLSNDLRRRYSLYIYREPLYDDRPIIMARLPRYYIKVSAIKKPRTS
jgi:hypothetical protein